MVVTSILGASILVTIQRLFYSTLPYLESLVANYKDKDWDDGSSCSNNHGRYGKLEVSSVLSSETPQATIVIVHLINALII